MRLTTVLVAAAMLAGCSASENVTGKSGDGAEAEVAAAAPEANRKGAEGTDRLKVSLPQLVYSYALGFVLPSDKIAEAQEAHRVLCENLGPARCQLLAMERDGGSEQSGGATLKLRVATADARAFSQSLTHQVVEAGGRAETTNVTADDVSKAMTDTAARIRQRELLVARLTEVLRTRKGSVAELVEAERSVAQGQEELDQAKAWLTELQGRVAMSDFEIHYTAIAPSASAGSTVGLLGEAAMGSGANFLIAMRVLLTLALYLLPWALVLGAIVWLIRRFRRSFATRPQV